MSEATPSPHLPRSSGKDYGIQIAFVFYLPRALYIADLTMNRYRTLSVRVEEKQTRTTSKSPQDPADAIASIDVHSLSVDEVYTRYSSHPTVGLELAAVRRRERDGKNVISPPPTVYWKKLLNYIFGGFNFLMWIAFILTIVSAVVHLPLSLF